MFIPDPGSTKSTGSQIWIRNTGPMSKGTGYLTILLSIVIPPGSRTALS